MKNYVRSLQVTAWQQVRSCRLFCLTILSIAWLLASPSASASQNADGDESIGRSGYLVRVPLPLIGNRDAEVIQQVRRIAEAARQGDLERPVVVLQFEPMGSGAGLRGPEILDTRGSQFERSLALARFLTEREASELRIVAFLPSTVEGHAVLPVLACQEVFAAPGVQLGRAGVDLPTDATILAAYQDIVSRGRTNIPEAAVQAMLEPNTELRRVSITDRPGIQVVTQTEANRLQDEGLISEFHETIWTGLGLAVFSAEQMRSWLWISPTIADPLELAAALDIQGGLRSVQQLPRDWKAVTVSIRGTLSRQRVSQIIRGLQDAVQNDDVNLAIFMVEQAECGFDEATRLASALVDLRENLYTAGFVRESLTGPLTLIPVVCNETVLLGSATLGPDTESSLSRSQSTAYQRVLDFLSAESERPLPLLAALVDKDTVVNSYTHQASGRRDIFTEKQIRQQVDREVWIPKTKIAGGGPIEQQVALQYGLVNRVEETESLALSRMGLTGTPEELATPWLDASIQKLVGQPWIPRLLLLIGMMALMIELGNPGISLGGLVSGLCFLGYFWIEGLNGNVEWLEILLFFGGLFALAIEVFVLPGFGIFGVTGLMMIFVSLVLAGQTFIWPSTSMELAQTASNLFWVAFIAFAGMVGLLFMHKQLERLPFFRWLTLQPAGTDEIEALEERESFVHYDHLLGQIGLTTTRLNPSGKAQFGSDIVSVVGSGGLIEAGTPVQVVEVRGNLIIVEENT
jgi:membrane-bound serine protease (ClpP class)